MEKIEKSVEENKSSIMSETIVCLGEYFLLEAGDSKYYIYLLKFRREKKGRESLSSLKRTTFRSNRERRKQD